METDKEINENLHGCFSVGFCMLALIVLCLMLAICSCKPQERLVEVEKWQHDTTTVTDTVHIKEYVTLHDSIYVTMTEHVKDSANTDVAWKYYTYGENGEVMSMLDYTSSTRQGSQKSSQSASTSTSNAEYQKEENASRTQSEGHSGVSNEKVYVKVGLSKWQKFIQILGYVMLITLVLGAIFGGMRLYGKKKKL